MPRGIFIGGYRLVVPLFSIWLTLVPVAVGAVIYGVVLLKLDRGIHDELRAMGAQMGAIAAAVVGGIRSCKYNSAAASATAFIHHAVWCGNVPNLPI